MNHRSGKYERGEGKKVALSCWNFKTDLFFLLLLMELFSYGVFCHKAPQTKYREKYLELRNSPEKTNGDFNVGAKYKCWV